jgi:IS605 OrfB family transposase
MRIDDLEERITDLEKKHKTLERQKRLVGKYGHNQKRKLTGLRHKLSALKGSEEQGEISICYGTKKLFKAQYNLAENGYASHEEWQRDWRSARSDEFFVIGSKGEKAGCQGCQIKALGDNRFKVQLRLPNVPAGATPKATTVASTAVTTPLVGKGSATEPPEPSNHIIFEVVVPYGAAHLERALAAGTSISFRFLRDKKGWRVLASTDVPGSPTTPRKPGAIGVDVNADHLAITEMDGFGNPVSARVIPCVTYGCSTDQANARIGDAVKQVIALAVETGKPLVVEKLDFQKKKRTLKDENPVYARMLSSLAYSRILSNLKARAHDFGLVVHEVNPAYTSLIGRHKFAARYGLSVHNAAALVIAESSI